MRPNLDLLAKGSFQITEEGVRIFYPNGLAGKGYVIENDAQFHHLFEQQKRWGLGIMLIITTLVVILVPWQIILTVFILLNLLKQYFIRRNTRLMKVSATPYSIDRFFGQALQLPTMKPVVLMIFMGFSALYGLAALGLTLKYPEIWKRGLGNLLFAILLFYLGLRQWRGR